MSDTEKQKIVKDLSDLLVRHQADVRTILDAAGYFPLVEEVRRLGTQVKKLKRKLRGADESPPPPNAPEGDAPPADGNGGA